MTATAKPRDLLVAQPGGAPAAAARESCPARGDAPASGTLPLAVSLMTLPVKGWAAERPVRTWVSPGPFPFATLAFHRVERRAGACGQIPLIAGRVA